MRAFCETYLPAWAILILVNGLGGAIIDAVGAPEESSVFVMLISALAAWVYLSWDDPRVGVASPPEGSRVDPLLVFLLIWSVVWVFIYRYEVAFYSVGFTAVFLLAVSEGITMGLIGSTLIQALRLYRGGRVAE